jgi:hypothetical protein
MDDGLIYFRDNHSLYLFYFPEALRLMEGNS